MKDNNRIITDFHAHIMPGADHGSRSLETSRQQLRLLHNAGVARVVATPHFYPQRDTVETFLERRERSLCELMSLDKNDRPEIYLGAEVLVCGGIDHMPGLEKLCVRGTNVILLEMPFSSWREEHIEAVGRISRQGFTVMMAHIDRYPAKDILKLCRECDVLYQLNGETMESFKGRKAADDICRELPVVAVGSDIHGADKSAAASLHILAKRLEKKGLDVQKTSETLLNGANKY